MMMMMMMMMMMLFCLCWTCRQTVSLHCDAVFLWSTKVKSRTNNRVIQNTPHLTNESLCDMTVWCKNTPPLYANFKPCTVLEYQATETSTRRLWIKQRSSFVNPTIVTKLQFIRIETELVYIGRRRTTSFNEDWYVNSHTSIASVFYKILYKIQNGTMANIVFQTPCLHCHN